MAPQSSGLAGVVPLELLLHPIEGSRQLLAAGPRRAPEPVGDLGPVAALGAEVGQEPLLVGEAAAVLLEQLAAGDQPAGGRGRVRAALQIGRVARLEPPIVAPASALPPRLIR